MTSWETKGGVRLGEIGTGIDARSGELLLCKKKSHFSEIKNHSTMFFWWKKRGIQNTNWRTAINYDVFIGIKLNLWSPCGFLVVIASYVIHLFSSLPERQHLMKIKRFSSAFFTLYMFMLREGLHQMCTFSPWHEGRRGPWFCDVAWCKY